MLDLYIFPFPPFPFPPSCSSLALIQTLFLLPLRQYILHLLLDMFDSQGYVLVPTTTLRVWHHML